MSGRDERQTPPVEAQRKSIGANACLPPPQEG